MAKRISIGGKVVVLIKDTLDLADISTFFIIGHGTKVAGKFVVNMEVNFPWGIDNYGWYEWDTGFPLKSIYTHYRQGIPIGLTQSTHYEIKRKPRHGAMADSLTTPLLSKSVNEIPNIDLTVDDLTVDFCEEMLNTFYTEGGAEDDVGVVCLQGAAKLADVFRYLSLAMKGSYADLLVFCLCCSVKKGEEHEADNRAAGYVKL
ncbi:hypothetical protein ACIP1T_21115 [Pseudomonas japonica]|uniref:hypothetical protein n=1 Tax=Pseudomonas TaxID=286 RepID=UPI0029299B0B|nr:hypothetical protein [Pseudomonas sp. zfem002]MDU9394063.1 hypothetical protein [Pseudomonas sp. zfem002]